MDFKGKDQFIRSLTSDLQPVKVIRPTGGSYLIWLLISAFGVAGTMLAIQDFRPGFWLQLLQGRFAVESIMALSPFFFCGYWAFRRSLPGRSQSLGGLVVGLISLGLFLASLIYGDLGADPSLELPTAGGRPFCVFEVLLLSWIPLGLMIYYMRGAYPLINFSLMMTIGIAGACLPMALMQIACAYAPRHVLFYHFLPFAIVVGFFTLIGQKLIKPA